MIEREKTSESLITHIVVEEALGEAVNISTMTSFGIRYLTLWRHRPDKTISFYDFENLSNTKEVKIFLPKGNSYKQVRLKPLMLKRISEYIAMEKDLRDGDYDCVNFAHSVNNVQYKNNVFKPELWNITKIEPDEEEIINPGDTLIISEKENIYKNGITHFAIALGDGLYLSKFGDTGRLIVTDLEEMQKGFGGEHFFVATPFEGDRSKETE